MKFALTSLFLLWLCVASAFGQSTSTNRTPLHNAYLQNGMNGNSQTISNATVVEAGTNVVLTVDSATGVQVVNTTGGGGGGSFTGDSTQFTTDGGGTTHFKTAALQTNFNGQGLGTNNGNFTINGPANTGIARLSLIGLGTGGQTADIYSTANDLQLDIGGTDWMFNNAGGITFDNTHLTSDGSGNVTGVSFTGAGSGLTSLNASSLSSGTVGTARLGSGSATANTLLHGNSTWSAVSLTADVTGLLPAANQSSNSIYVGTNSNAGFTNSGPVTLSNPANIIDGNGGGLTNLSVPASGITGTIPYRVDAGGVYTNWAYAGDVISYNQTNYDTYELRCGTTIKRNGLCYVFYGVDTANSAANSGQIAYAVGNTFNNMSVGGLALTNSTSGWDSNHVQGPRIFTDNGVDYLYYFGGTNTGFEGRPNSIGVATQAVNSAWSPTGWTKYSGNPLLGPTNTYSTNSQWRPCVVKNGALYYLYHNAGNASQGESICFATATSPLGPFTEYSGNPVIPVPSTKGDTIAQDPSIVQLPDNTWLMAYSTCCGGNITICMAWSPDLTNWITNPYIPLQPAAVMSAFAPVQSFELFNDGGLCALFDDEHTIHLIKASQATQILPYALNIGNGTGAHFNYALNVATNGANGEVASFQNTSASGYSDAAFFSSGSSREMLLGYANGSANNYAGQDFIETPGIPLNITTGGSTLSGIYLDASGNVTMQQSLTITSNLTTGTLTLPVLAKTGNYTWGANDTIVQVTNGGVLTLPDLTTVKGKVLMAVNLGGGTLIITNFNGSQKFNYAGYLAVSNNLFCVSIFHSDGTNYIVDSPLYTSSFYQGGGGGSGTVTSVTFTGDGTVESSTPSSAVTTSGTVTATLANAAAYSVLNNNTSSSAAPVYTASPIVTNLTVTNTHASGFEAELGTNAFLVVSNGTTVANGDTNGNIYAQSFTSTGAGFTGNGAGLTNLVYQQVTTVFINQSPNSAQNIYWTPTFSTSAAATNFYSAVYQPMFNGYITGISFGAYNVPSGSNVVAGIMTNLVVSPLKVNAIGTGTVVSSTNNMLASANWLYVTTNTYIGLYISNANTASLSTISGQISFSLLKNP